MDYYLLFRAASRNSNSASILAHHLLGYTHYNLSNFCKLKKGPNNRNWSYLPYALKLL